MNMLALACPPFWCISSTLFLKLDFSRLFNYIFLGYTSHDGNGIQEQLLLHPFASGCGSATVPLLHGGHPIKGHVNMATR